MAAINTSTLFNSSRGFDYTLVGLNQASNYLFGDFLLIAIFVLMLMLLRGYAYRDGFLSASLITLLFCFVMWISGFVDYARLAVCFAAVIVAFIFSWMKD